MERDLSTLTIQYPPTRHRPDPRPRTRQRRLRWRSRPWRMSLWRELREFGWMFFAWACTATVIATAIMLIMALQNRIEFR